MKFYEANLILMGGNIAWEILYYRDKAWPFFMSGILIIAIQLMIWRLGRK